MRRAQQPLLYDSRGNKINASLYLTPLNSGNPMRYRPRFFSTPQDYDKTIDLSTRTQIVSFCRELYAQSATINGCIYNKSSWGFGSGWLPTYTGQNQEWGKLATSWLIDNWYKVCSTKGQPFDFRTLLELMSVSLDIDGDCALIFTKSRDGFPLLQLVEGHRIGQRNSQDKTVTSGPFRNKSIVNGVIKNNAGRTIGYRILGDNPNGDEDIDLPASSCFLVFEPEYISFSRGIPRLACAVLDAADISDIDEYLKRIVKLESQVGLLHTNESGEADIAANNILTEEDENVSSIMGNSSNVYTETLNGGSIQYLKADSGKLESFNTQRPASQTTDFVKRIEKRICWAIGYPWELMNPETIGGASVRLITDQARKSISQRQDCIEIYAKLSVNFALATAMQEGYIPQNYEDFYKWSFLRPTSIVIDAGYERQADISDLKMGIKTLDNITAKYGQSWIDVRAQIQRESDDLVARAIELSTKYPQVSFNRALDLLSQRGSNLMPDNPPEQPQEASTKPE